MLTIDEIIAYSEQTIAERYMAGDREGLRRVQLALGVLMDAAQQAGDRDSYARFRSLATRSADKQESLEGHA